jgi:hypothetical protein
MTCQYLNSLPQKNETGEQKNYKKKYEANLILIAFLREMESSDSSVVEGDLDPPKNIEYPFISKSYKGLLTSISRSLTYSPRKGCGNQGYINLALRKVHCGEKVAPSRVHVDPHIQIRRPYHQFLFLGF